MFYYKGTEKFDIGKGYGEFEYDFFSIESEEDFWSLMNHYGFIFKRFNYHLDGYKVKENNTGLSPVVQSKMKEYNANICLTFLVEEYTKDNIGMKQVIVNEKKSDETFNLYCFNVYHFEEIKIAKDDIVKALEFNPNDEC